MRKDVIVVLIAVFAVLSLITTMPLLDLIKANANASLENFAVVMVWFIFVGITAIFIFILIDQSSHTALKKTADFVGANPYVTARYCFIFVVMMIITLLISSLEIISVFIKLPFYGPMGAYSSIPILAFFGIGLFCRWSYKNAISEAIKSGVFQEKEYLSVVKVFTIIVAIVVALAFLIFAIHALVLFSYFSALI